MQRFLRLISMDKVETLLQNNYEALSSLRGLCLDNIVNANV